MGSLLFHRGTEWGGTVRGSTNVIAEHFLAAGNRVAWMMRPRHLGHWLLRRGSTRSAWRADDGALVISPYTVVPRLPWRLLGQSAWSGLSRGAYTTITPDLRKTFARFDQPEPEVIWTCGGDGGALRRYFPRARRIVQCVDLYEAFGGTAQKQIEMLDYADADAVVTIGESLAQFLRDHRGVPSEKITVIGQGADLELFQKDHQEPPELCVAARPRLVWVGVTAKADAALMEAALRALPDGMGSLVVIGPSATWAEALRARDSRVMLAGPRHPRDVPAFLKHCDVGLMLYDQSVNPMKYMGQNPLKLYEFAAAGLPIVSTPHEEYRYLNPPALIARDSHEVIECVRKALAERVPLAEASKAFASQNSWRQRFEEALELVTSLLSAPATASAP